jgi:hypothetical protein
MRKTKANANTTHRIESRMTQSPDTPEVHPTASAEHRETHQIHTSEVRSFNGCRRRWDWAYRQGFVLDQAPKPLELGIAFHIGMEKFYDPEAWDSTSKEEKASRAVVAFTEECERQRAAFLKATNQERILVAEGDDYTERIDLGIGMIEHYANYIHPVDDDWFRPVMTEVAFQVPLTDPRTGEPLRCFTPGTHEGGCGQFHPVGALVTYDGRVDMLIEDIANGGYFVWDHKSAAQVQTSDHLIQMDPQVVGYTWALRTVLELDIRGFIYAEYRKDYPKAPALLKNTIKGRHFSTNKQQGTNLAVFLEHVKKYDFDAYQDGCYDEFIAWLKSKDAPVFHQRFPILKTPYELDQMGYNLSMQASEMVRPSLPIYPAPGRFSCSGCGYYTPCNGKNRGEDYEYTLNSLYRKVK